MKKKYKIIPDMKFRSCLTVNPFRIEELNIAKKGIWYFRFGLQAFELKVETSDEIAIDELHLSIDVIDQAGIPLDSQYEITIFGNEIIIGPYIGILATHEQSRLEELLYASYSKYIYDYPAIGGAILIFSLEGVDTKNDIIEGFMYNPVTDIWEKGQYCYPSSIFKTISMNKELRSFFQTKYKDRIFNIYNFNKWQMYDWLSNISTVKDYLPETYLYKKVNNIESLIVKHEELYIKPIYGSRGRGIFKVSNLQGKYKISYDKNDGKQEVIVNSIVELLEFLESQIKHKAYIIQRAIVPQMIDERMVDYRMILTKDQSGNWKENGLVSRLGMTGNITSNISTGGEAEDGETILQKSFGIDAHESFRLHKKMREVAFEAALGLEKSGVHCGNLGIDMLLGKDQQIWIIEINNINPNALIMVRVGDRNQYYKVKLANMLYAKKLAGFSEEEA